MYKILFILHMIEGMCYNLVGGDSMAGSTEYKNKWAAENLDQLRITVPKGKRGELDALAKDRGYKGYADYIKAVVTADSGIQLSRPKRRVEEDEREAGQSVQQDAATPVQAPQAAKTRKELEAELYAKVEAFMASPE
jgi:hypothetical protein